MTGPKPQQNSEEEKSQKIMEKREAIELISFKVSMTFLEKVLIVLKQNKLSEGK